MREVVGKLADVQSDTSENDREKRRKEAVDNLKRVFPDKVTILTRYRRSRRRFYSRFTVVSSISAPLLTRDSTSPSLNCSRNT